MSITFKLAPSISVELPNPSTAARSLVRALSTPNQSIDDLMSTFLSFLRQLAIPFYVTDAYDPRPAFLVAAAMCHFYNPLAARPIYKPILIEHMDAVAPVVIPLMLHTLEFSFSDPQRQSYNPEDVFLLSILSALLQHETGIAHFADTTPTMLSLQIRIIVWMWIEVSGSTSPNALDTDLVKIIQALTKYAPTRRPLELVVASTPRSVFRTGLNRLNAAVSELENQDSPYLSNSLLANMRGIGAICIVRPKLRNYLVGNGLVTSLCSLLAYAIIDQPRMVAPEEWPAEKYGAYHFILAISEELHLLFKDEVDSPSLLLQALNCRLFDSIHCALHHFGRSMLTPCGRMPFLLEYIWYWAMKSRRVAHKVLVELNDLRSYVGSWNELPRMPSRNLLTMAWHVFVTRFDKSVQASPESGRLSTMCMNPECSERGMKRCQNCKILVVCSEACFRVSDVAGVHVCRD